MFEIVPAVDLKAGRCVRLLQGRADAETVFSDDPVAMARRWQDSRARRLHVVDLDGAFAGRPTQTELVRAMIAAVRIPVQVGGGLRELAHVEAVLEAGARWAIVGIDASDGRVAVDGWTRVLDLDAIALARDAAAAGAAGIIYTDIARDGLLQGLNLDATIALAEAVNTPVIASGGLASIDDVKQMLAPRARKLAGAIAGRALYDGRLDPAEALKLIRDARAAAR